MAEQLRIDPADARARVDAGEAIVLDVVSPMAWEQFDRAVHFWRPERLCSAA